MVARDAIWMAARDVLSDRGATRRVGMYSRHAGPEVVPVVVADPPAVRAYRTAGHRPMMLALWSLVLQLHRFVAVVAAVSSS